MLSLDSWACRFYIGPIATALARSMQGNESKIAGLTTLIQSSIEGLLQSSHKGLVSTAKVVYTPAYLDHMLSF